MKTSVVAPLGPTQNGVDSGIVARTRQLDRAPKRTSDGARISSRESLPRNPTWVSQRAWANGRRDASQPLKILAVRCRLEAFEASNRNR